jgi:hypothetical protein
MNVLISVRKHKSLFIKDGICFSLCGLNPLSLDDDRH